MAVEVTTWGGGLDGARLGHRCGVGGLPRPDPRSRRPRSGP